MLESHFIRAHSKIGDRRRKKKKKPSAQIVQCSCHLHAPAAGSENMAFRGSQGGEMPQSRVNGIFEAPPSSMNDTISSSCGCPYCDGSCRPSSDDIHALLIRSPQFSVSSQPGQYLLTAEVPMPRQANNPPRLRTGVQWNSARLCTAIHSTRGHPTGEVVPRQFSAHQSDRSCTHCSSNVKPVST